MGRVILLVAASTRVSLDAPVGDRTKVASRLLASQRCQIRSTCDPATPRTLRTVAALRRANVKLLAGTDAGIGPVRAGTSLHCELATLVAAGLTPYEALQAATVNAGTFVRTHLRPPQAPFGTVTVGSRAELVLLASDPRVEIGAVTRPVGVALRGA